MSVALRNAVLALLQSAITSSSTLELHSFQAKHSPADLKRCYRKNINNNQIQLLRLAFKLLARNLHIWLVNPNGFQTHTN